MLKYPHLQKDITSLNLNVPNKVASKFIKQKLTKPKQDINYLIIIQDFKLLPSVIDVSSTTTTTKTNIKY